MPNNTGNNKRIAKNSIVLYIRLILVLFVSLYTTRVVLNVLGVVDYGIYNIVAGFVSMFAFLNSAMNNTTQRYYNYDRGTGDFLKLCKTYNTALCIQIILAIILFILLESFGLWYINNKMIIPLDRLEAAKFVFHCSVLSLLFLVLQIPYSASIISHEKMNFYAIVSVLDVLLKLLVVIFLPYLNHDKLKYYGLFMLSISLINFLLYFIYAKKNFEEIKIQKNIEKSKFKEMLSFSGWNLFGSFAYTMQGQGINVLINAFFGPIVNAARGVTFQIQSAINGFAVNITTAFRPQLVDSYAKSDFQRTRNLMFSMSKYCYIMLYILSLPIALELHFILDLWLKGSIPQYTIVFTYLVLANMLVNSLNMPISQTVQATGKVRYYQIICSILVFLALPVSWFFLKMGAPPFSVFVITLIISIVNQPISMMILRKNFIYSYKSYMKLVLYPCLLFTILTPIIPMIIHLIIDESLLRLIVVVVVSLTISFIVLFFIVLTNAEKQVILKFLSNFRKHLIN